MMVWLKCKIIKMTNAYILRLVNGNCEWTNGINEYTVYILSDYLKLQNAAYNPVEIKKNITT